MDKYTVDVGPIMETTGADLIVEDALDFEPLTLGAETFPFKTPASFTVTVINTVAGLVAAGVVQATVEAECSRCLVHFDMQLHGTVEGFYVTKQHAEGLPEEQAYELITDGRIDLLPAIRQALAVEAPYAPLHDERCAGICPTCGCDRNVETCACEPVAEGSPFEALKGILEEK